jgi:hypothetical protein
VPDESAAAVLCAAVYNHVDSALADLEAFEQLHEAKVIGKYDAAVMEKEEGKPPHRQAAPSTLASSSPRSGSVPENCLAASYTKRRRRSTPARRS